MKLLGNSVSYSNSEQRKDKNKYKNYQDIIIGFGKGGKTLAGQLGKQGRKVALIEKSPDMYGGTCINIACIPTKALEYESRISQHLGGTWEERQKRYRDAVAQKNSVTSLLNQKNYEKVVSAGVDVIDGTASFTGTHTVCVLGDDGTKTELEAERIFINTGATSFIPDIEGLKDSKRAYTSTTLMELSELPKHLVIIGGGYIGLEFASYYNNFGSQVTILQTGDTFIPREDREIASAILESFASRGIEVMQQVEIQSVKDTEAHAVVTVKTADGKAVELEAQAVLVATGRRPNVEGLDVEKAGVKLTKRGAVEVDENLQTAQPHIWAMGDVIGDLQFTYISLDDSRIVASQLKDGDKRTTKNRGEIPYSVFIDPPLARVGVTQKEAEEEGHEVSIFRLPASAIPKTHILQQKTGVLKAIVDKKTDLILGAHFFCAESYEMINLVKFAIDHDLPYTELRDRIYTHPTMTEALNDLFATPSEK